LNKELKNKLRSDLFQHLDGIVTGPTAYVLHKRGVLDYILEKKRCTLKEIESALNANEGYLNVALHTLVSQGWLEIKRTDEDIEYGVNDFTEIATKLIPLYKDVVDLMHLSAKFHHRKFEKEPFLKLEKIAHQFNQQYGIELSSDEKIRKVQTQFLKHIEGHIVGPTVVALGMSGMFHNYFTEACFRPEEFHADGELFGRLLDIFVGLEWFEKKSETYRFTDKGMFFARRASAYGVTVSYIPMFRKLEELIFGDPTIFWNLPKGATEIHVDRTMNVWGSGGAHSNYFKVVDKIIIDIFNQPLDQQPKGILDMGCGNGAFLIHLYDVIEQQTLRGQHLEDHPLFLVGVDYNKAALNVTRANIVQANIWAKLMWGDIGKPDLLASDLAENYNIKLEDLLNVRTFLDHNRIWAVPADSTFISSNISTGAYAFRGRRITSQELANNLKEHLEQWSPYVEKFGLLIIELHTIAPELIANNLGRTAATAYNATHGFSDQYIVEIDFFKEIAAEVGLSCDEAHFKRYPNSDLATVSISLLKKE
jgi:DNA-binding MarR family transcriptional regulator